MKLPKLVFLSVKRSLISLNDQVSLNEVYSIALLAEI